MKKKLPVSVLFFIGCYKNEIYDKKRIEWLKKSINDLKKQTEDPQEILISTNKTIYKNKIVKELIETNFQDSNFFISNFYRSPLLNFESLIQLANEKYICFWSDHDLHHPNFLKDLYKVISSNQVSHVCPIYSAVPANEDDIKDSHIKVLSSVNTANMKKVKRFSKCINTQIMGSFYGIWEKDIYKNLEIVGHEKLDFLPILASSLEKGYIYFESSANLFGLRLTPSNASKHSTICPNNIFSPRVYSISNFYRFYISALQIIDDSSLTNSEKLKCISIFEKSFKARKNLFGASYLGIRLLIKEFILLLTFRTNLHEFLFLFSYSIYANYLRKKKINLINHRN